MPVGFNSPARNLFLLGSSGAQVVTNFFKTIDQSAGTDQLYLPDEIKYNDVDQKFVLAGSASDSQVKGFGWLEKRQEDGTQDWGVRVEATQTGVNTTLLAMELDVNDKLIVGGKTGDVPWIAKYSNGGVIEWQSTTNTANLEYTSITSDSNGQYYACGSQYPGSGAVAFVEKFDANGNPGWGKAGFMLGREVLLNAIAANSRGEVVAVGQIEDDNSYKGYIVKIDTNTGEVLWDRTLTQHLTAYGYVVCRDVYIDSKDQIYIVGARSGGNPSEPTEGFLIKYSPEGNIIWQKASYTPNGTLTNYAVKSDGETEQTIVFGTYYDQINNDLGGVLSKYSKNGDLVWRRTIYSSYNNSDVFGSLALDADPSFYYLLYVDDNYNALNGTPEAYTFGKVSSSGNGLGDFQYEEGTGETIDYEILNVQDKIGRLSDGSVRQDTSDLITYPFNANKIVFDDLATQVSNKKRQMDSPDSFEYSGSPAVRPVDLPTLYLDAKNDARNGTVVDPDSGIVGTYNTFGPFTGSNSVYLGGTNANSDTYGWQGYVNLYQLNTSTNAAAPNLDIGTDLWTMEAWFYITEYPSSTAVLMSLRHSQYLSTPDTLLITSSGTLAYSYQEGALGNNSDTIPLNTWVHIAMAKDPTDDTRTMVLLNGTCSWKPGNGRTTGHSNTGNFYARLGWSLFAYTTNYQYLKGYISNYRFSLDNVYGTSNIGDSYTVPTSTLGLLPSTKILALHKGLSNFIYNGGSFNYGILDQTTCEGPWAGTSNDIFASPLKYILVALVPNYRTLQVRGAKIYGLTDRVNRERGYWEFNGVDDEIDFGNQASIITSGSFTVEAWAWRDTITAENGLFDIEDSNQGVILLSAGNNGGNDYRFLVRKGTYGAGPVQANVEGAITGHGLNEWHHYLGTYDDDTGTIIMYVDGVQVDTDTNASIKGVNFSGTLDSGIHIGPSAGRGRWHDGRIGEVRVYPKALTAAQVFQNYNASKSKYINEAPDTAPKISDSAIVYDSNLLLNYDFGNKATFDTKETSFTKITPPTAGNGATFGHHTRQLSNGFVTGEPWNGNGVVYWYDKNGSNVATVADPTGSGSWGYYIFSDGDDRVLVNAPFYNDGSTEGFLYVYDGSGNLQYTIPRPEYNPGVNHPTWSNIEEICAIGEGKIAVMDVRFYDPGTTNQRGAVWIMDEDGTNQVRVLSPEVSPGSGTYNDFNYNIFIDNGYVYVYTSTYGVSGNTWTVIDFNGNIIRDFLPTEDGAAANQFGYPAGAGGGRFIIHSRGDESLGIPAKTYIYDSTNNFNLVGTFESEYGHPYGGDYGTQSFYVSNGHIYAAYDDMGVVVSYDLNGNFEKVFTGPQYLSLSRLSNGREDYFGYNNLIDFGDGSYVIPASYDSDSDGAVYILKANKVKNLSSSSYPGTFDANTAGQSPEFNSNGYMVFGSQESIRFGSLVDLGFPSGSQSHTITVECWVQSNTAANHIFAGIQGPDTERFYLARESGGWEFGWGNHSWTTGYTGGTSTADRAAVVLDTWTHYCLSAQSGVATLYINGIRTVEKTDTTVNFGSGDFPIGSFFYPANTYNVSYGSPNSIAEFRIYNRALTEFEAEQNFLATRGKYGV